jgi:hypothetical protein
VTFQNVTTIYGMAGREKRTMEAAFTVGHAHANRLSTVVRCCVECHNESRGTGAIIMRILIVTLLLLCLAGTAYAACRTTVIQGTVCIECCTGNVCVTTCA